VHRRSAKVVVCRPRHALPRRRGGRRGRRSARRRRRSARRRSARGVGRGAEVEALACGEVAVEVAAVRRQRAVEREQPRRRRLGPLLGLAHLVRLDDDRWDELEEPLLLARRRKEGAGICSRQAAGHQPP